MIKDQRQVGFKNQDHELLTREDQLIEKIQQQRGESPLKNVSITSNNYVNKEDNDVHDINDNMSITEQEEQDYSFLDDGLVEIEDSEEFKDPHQPEETTNNPMF